MSARSPRHRRGFTAVEMLVVIAIIGILAAFAVPRFIEMRPKDQLRSAAKDMVANLRQARAIAITGKSPSTAFPFVIERVDVIFDTAADTYTLQLVTLDPAAPLPKTLTYKVGRMGDYNTQLQLTLNTVLPANTLIFRRNGGTDNFASFQLDIPNYTETRTIVVTRAGLARVDW